MKVLFVESEETFYMDVKAKIPKRWVYLVEVANYVKSQGHEVKVLDCLDPNISHAEVLKEIAKGDYDLICFLMRIESVNSMMKLIPLIKKISPLTKLLVYGDAPCMFINFIKDNFKELDAIIEGGDWEVAICNFIRHLERYKEFNVKNNFLKEKIFWYDEKVCKDNKFLEWSLPDLDNEICNSDLYLSLKDDEVTVSVSRGCPYNCKFCLAVKTFDKLDRRKNPEEIVAFMRKYQNRVKTFKLFSPTFTYDEEWVKKFCNLLLLSNVKTKWVTTSRPDKLQNAEIIKLMSDAGCIRIAVGIETLDETSNKELNKFGDITNYKNVILNMFEISNKYNIEIKPLLMIGIKGQTKKNLKETLDFLKSCGAKTVRIAAYSPRQYLTKEDLKGTLSLERINQMDKMTYINFLPEGISEEIFVKLIYNSEDYEELLK